MWQITTPKPLITGIKNEGKIEHLMMGAFGNRNGKEKQRHGGFD